MTATIVLVAKTVSGLPVVEGREQERADAFAADEQLGADHGEDRDPDGEPEGRDELGQRAGSTTRSPRVQGSGAQRAGRPHDTWSSRSRAPWKAATTIGTSAPATTMPTRVTLPAPHHGTKSSTSAAFGIGKATTTQRLDEALHDPLAPHHGAERHADGEGDEEADGQPLPGVGEGGAEARCGQHQTGSRRGPPSTAATRSSAPNPRAAPVPRAEHAMATRRRRRPTRGARQATDDLAHPSALGPRPPSIGGERPVQLGVAGRSDQLLAAAGAAGGRPRPGRARWPDGPRARRPRRRGRGPRRRRG